MHHHAALRIVHSAQQRLPILLFVLVSAMAGSVSWARQAQDAPDKPSNLDFEGERIEGRFPAGWGGGGEGYSLEVDTDAVHGGKTSGRVRFVGPNGTFGTLTQCISPAAFRGKRVRYSGYLKTDGVEQGAGLWMRVDGPENRALGFDNMQNRAAKGTTDWKRYEIDLDVPKDATLICFGFLVAGKGTVWGDDLKIEPVGEPGKPVTTQPKSDAGKLAEVVGHVMEADDKPLADAHVLIVIKTWPNNRYTQRAFAAKTDKEGLFRLPELYPPDERHAVMVNAIANGHAMETFYQLNQQGGKLEPIALRLAKATPLALKFVDAAGKPVKGVTAYPAMRTTRDNKPHLVYHQGSDPIWKESDAEGFLTMSYFLKGEKARISFRLPGQDWGPVGTREFVVDKEELVIEVAGGAGSKKESAGLNGPLSEQDAVRVKWLADNAIRMRSIKPDDEDSSDLEPLKKVIGDARVVQLGDSGAWLKTKITSRPLGYSNMQADWTQVLDGMVFTRTMTPSTRRQ